MIRFVAELVNDLSLVNLIVVWELNAVSSDGSVFDTAFHRAAAFENGVVGVTVLGVVVKERHGDVVVPHAHYVAHSKVDIVGARAGIEDALVRVVGVVLETCFVNGDGRVQHLVSA